MENEQIKKVVDLLPLIRQLFDHDVHITVMDKEGIVQGYAVPDGVRPQIITGDSFNDPTGTVAEVIRTGRKKHNHLPVEVMGEAFEGTVAPIADGRSVVGCICCAYPSDDRQKITSATGKFQKSMNNIDNSINNVVDGIEKLFDMLTEMDEMTTGVENDVKTAVDVVNKISSNASRSNILALNASIEAARSGEHGRGFSVVATEMGKLANDSGSSATEIKATLNTITSHLSTIISSIKGANDMAKEHMESINKIQSILQETIELAKDMEKDIK